MGVLDRFNINKLKEGLSKTRDAIVARVTKLVTARGTIDEVSLEQLEEILIGADVGTGATSEIIAALRKRVGEQRYSTPAELIGLLKEVLQGEIVPVAASAEIPAAVTSGPYVIMVVGVNGAGKTTTIGKLAHQYVSEGKSVVIGAADTFRAAANEQLEIWAQRSGAKLIRQQQGSDPAAVAFDAVHSAIAQKADVVIIDTAGRLHTKVNLMEELGKVGRIVKGTPEDSTGDRKGNPGFPPRGAPGDRCVDRPEWLAAGKTIRRSRGDYRLGADKARWHLKRWGCPCDRQRNEHPHPVHRRGRRFGGSPAIRQNRFC